MPSGPANGKIKASNIPLGEKSLESVNICDIVSSTYAQSLVRVKNVSSTRVVRSYEGGGGDDDRQAAVWKPHFLYAQPQQTTSYCSCSVHRHDCYYLLLLFLFCARTMAHYIIILLCIILYVVCVRSAVVNLSDFSGKGCKRIKTRRTTPETPRRGINF